MLSAVLPDAPDARDFTIAALGLSSVDGPGIDPWASPISTQNGPDCTMNATCDALELVTPLPIRQLSRRFLAHETLRQRGQLGGVPFNGASLRDVLGALRRAGVCLEELWPYSESWDLQPGVLAYADAEARRSIASHRCTSVEDVDTALASGMPVIAAFAVGAGFNRGDTIVDAEPSTRGGHAVILCRREGSTFRLRNSWGESWGDRGTCLVTEAWVRACWDLWAVRP